MKDWIVGRQEKGDNYQRIQELDVGDYTAYHVLIENMQNLTTKIGSV